MDRTRKDRLVTPSRLAYTFLGTFITAIFLLQWWQRSSYPTSVWIGLGVVGGLGLLVNTMCRGEVLYSFEKYKKSHESTTSPDGTCRPFGKLRVTYIFSMLLSATLGIALALLTVSLTTHVPSPATVDWYVDGSVGAIRGIISDQPDRKPTRINYIVNVIGMQRRTESSALSVRGKVLVADKRMWPRFQLGDDVLIEGTLMKPTTSDTFAYDQYLSRFAIYATLSASHMELMKPAAAHKVLRALSVLRDAFEAQINRIFPEPSASFLAGLLTGAQHAMPDELLDTFRTTGITHIVAISGFNITIIVSVIGSLLFFLPLRWRFVPSIVGITLFTLLIGASASVVRAAIMGILGLLALQTGRMRHARLAILWTAFFMILWNPKILWYDVGFQLSFLAVIGLTESGPLLKPWTKFLPDTLGIREAIEMTLAAQLFAVPWIVARFGTLSLVSPVTNLLVAPFIPFAMLFGFLGTVLSYFWFPLGQAISFVAWGLLSLIIAIAELLALIPFASVTIPTITPILIVLYYAGLIGWITQTTRKMGTAK